MLSLALFKLTLQSVLSDIPLDAGSAIVLVMMVAFVAFVWLGSRGGAARARPAVFDAAEDSPVAPPTPARAERGAEAEAVVIHASTLSAGSGLRHTHPEVR